MVFYMTSANMLKVLRGEYEFMSSCFVTSDDNFYEGVKSILDEIVLDSVKHLKDII